MRENALHLAEKHGTPEIIATAAKLVDDPDAKVRLQLAFTLGEWKDAAAGEALGRLAVANYAEPFTFAAVMSSAVPHVKALTDAALKAGGKPLTALAEPLARIARGLNETQTLAALRDVQPAEKPKPVARPPIAPPGSRAKVIAAFQLALKLAGDAARGREVFAQRCVACHKLGELGQDIGPNLVSVAGHPPEKLLVNILDPNADVQPGFYAYVCKLNDGAEIYGMMAIETANSIVFKQLDGTARAVLRQDIASLESTKASLMPAGLEAGLAPQGMADLIAFLRAGGARAETKKGAVNVRVLEELSHEK